MSTTNQDNTVEYVKNPPDPKTASAWIEKDTYTRDEVREISEARRIAGIWDVIGDPDSAQEGILLRELAQNYVNCLKVVHGIRNAGWCPTIKDAYNLVSNAVKAGKFKPFFTEDLPYICDILEYFKSDIDYKKQLDINTVVKKSLEYWANDTSISEDEKEKLARKYGEVLYDWSRFECDCSDFEPKSISETKSYMQTLLERNQEYIDGKRLKGVN